MGDSLRDQMLKAGLISAQQFKQAKTAKRKKNRQTKGAAQEEQALRVKRAAAEKAARDRALNRQRAEAAQRKAEEHQLRQLIHSHRILRTQGEIAFHFQDGTKLKHLYLDAGQRRELAAGKIALVRQDTGYELVPASIAERIRERRPELILVFHRGEPGGGASDEGSDPYEAYPVPDDLMW